MATINHFDRTFRYYRIMFFRHDFSAGLTVFLVALPLCLGIALASGAPLYSGLISGIIGGIVVGAISGSNFAVSGPAAGLSTVVAGSILLMGDFRIFLLSVIIAGVFQLLLGIFKLGIFASYFPSSVIKGMLASIGIILISKQIPVALGYNGPNFWTSGLLDIFSSPNVVQNLEQFNSHITLGAVVISCICLTVLIVLSQPKFKKFNVIPAPLVVVLLGVGLVYLFGFNVSPFALDSKQMVNIPMNIMKSMQFPEFDQSFTTKLIWKDGLVIGILATLETLLCIEAMDKMDRHNRITPVNRELIAQGIGNITCGLLGAIPLTAVVVRGAANVNAGAKTKLSAIFHGVLLLLAVVVFPFVINMIPYASLASILIMTGFALTKPKLYRNIFSLGLDQFVPFVVTIVVVLATDLLLGVTVGLLVSIYYIVRHNYKESYDISTRHQFGLNHYVLNLHSNVTFLNKMNIKKSLDRVPPYSVLTIDGSNVHFMDYDIIEVISEFKNKAHDRHIELHMVNINLVKTFADDH